MNHFAVSLTAHTKASEGGRTVDVVSDQIDALIGKRSRMQEQGRDEEMAWKESVRRHHATEQARIRWEWVRYYGHMQKLHTALATSYEDRARQLEEAT